ncbi:MAG: glycoside hydrolase, partial [Novosphingobium sp.]|nr:glycoside hydrolase [Novosphingobium sp.]
RSYEGRADLGNTQPGDGKRFMGRGLIQVTGRANYTEMAMRSGLPLVEQPELLEQPDAAVLVSAIWWDMRRLNALVDAGREDDVTRRINGGTNGLSDRRARVARAKAMMA